MNEDKKAKEGSEGGEGKGGEEGEAKRTVRCLFRIRPKATRTAVSQSFWVSSSKPALFRKFVAKILCETAGSATTAQTMSSEYSSCTRVAIFSATDKPFLN